MLSFSGKVKKIIYESAELNRTLPILGNAELIKIGVVKIMPDMRSRINSQIIKSLIIILAILFDQSWKHLKQSDSITQHFIQHPGK